MSLWTNPVPTLTTNRLVLDAPRAQDRDALVVYAGDLSVSRWLGQVPHPYTREDADTFVTELAPALGCFAVRESADGPLLGVVGLAPVVDGAGMLGYWLGPPHWGRGYATEAAAAVVAFGFATLRLPRIDSGYFEGNDASGRVLAKLGFRETGHRSLRDNAALQRRLSHVDMVLEPPDPAKG